MGLPKLTKVRKPALRAPCLLFAVIAIAVRHSCKSLGVVDFVHSSAVSVRIAHGREISYPPWMSALTDIFHRTRRHLPRPKLLKTHRAPHYEETLLADTKSVRLFEQVHDPLCASSRPRRVRRKT